MYFPGMGFLDRLPPPLHMINIYQLNYCLCDGSVLVNDVWPPPPPINFLHDQISIYLALFTVRLTLSGPSAAATG